MTRWATITAAATLAGVLATPPTKAAEWPWCADYGGGGRGGTTNCGFASWEQCQINIRGIGGWCYRNPYYTPRQRRNRRHR